MTQVQATTRTVDTVEIPTPGTFSFDPAHTVVGATARHLMVSKVRGKFADVAGSIVVAENPLDSNGRGRHQGGQHRHRRG